MTQNDEYSETRATAIFATETFFERTDRVIAELHEPYRITIIQREQVAAADAKPKCYFIVVLPNGKVLGTEVPCPEKKLKAPVPPPMV